MIVTSWGLCPCIVLSHIESRLWSKEYHGQCGAVCDFWLQCYKAWSFYFEFLGHSLCRKSAAMLWGCSGSPVEGSTWRETEVFQTASINLTAMVVIHFGSRSCSPVKPSGDYSLGWHLTVAHETPKPELSNRTTPEFLTHKNYELSKWFLFYVYKFGRDLSI